jgi:uracil-DNA glycosylase
MSIKIEKTWKKELGNYFSGEEFKKLAEFVKNEYLNKIVYPPPKDLFRAFNETPFDKVRVVILGQDPYHGPGQAHGLCFSVPKGVPAPPSLKNIFKEICNELPESTSCRLAADKRTDLNRWAKQGVFLLNAVLTVLKNKAGSHGGKGWEDFTDFVIKRLSDRKEKLVFILWGNFARSKKDLIDSNKHLILESPHPSPFSADRGFFGNKHFKMTNEYLKQHGFKEIDW